MKRYTILLILISAALLVTGCFLQNPVDQIDGLLGEGEFLSEGEETGIIPDDIIADVPRNSSKSFSFETMLPVQLVVDAEFYTSSFEPLAAESRQVIVTLKNSDGILIYGGITDEAGELNAEVRLPGASEAMTLSLHAEGYDSREVVIPEMVRFEKIDRVMGMAAVPNVSRDIFGLTDTDGDGIPDVYDAYPDDEDSAFAYLMPADGYLTVAYEDLFGRAGAGDADYNDFISHYSIEESSNSEGITKIKVNAEAAVKLAGYNHTFGIRINSFVPPADLKVNYIDDYGNPASYSTRITEYPNPGETSLEIVLFEHTGKAAGKTADFTLDFTFDDIEDNPQDPAVLSRPPYNPFLYVLNTGHDVHLIDEEPLAGSINPDDTFRDAEGFPWALLVPPGPTEEGGWAHPDEGVRIEEPYPRFTRWRESGGELSPDWYLHDTPWEPEKAVYAAGYYNNGTNDVAAYWKDGVKTDLTDGSENARATDIFVYNGDIYVSGYYKNGGQDTAVWWKNGVQQADLESGGNPAKANSIYVANGDVYIAGYYDNGTADVAVWWKNGIKQPDLTGPTANSVASSIFFENGNVYISGKYDDGTYPYVATYWVNGVKIGTDLYNEKSEALDLFVDSGGDIYISGFFFNASVPTLGSSYWVNNSAGHVPLYDTGFSYAYGITVDSGNVYSSGYYQAGTDIACYWVNGSKTDLDNGRGLDIALDEGVIYVSGYYFDGDKRRAVLWENGTRTDLYDSEVSGVNAEALAVIVK